MANSIQVNRKFSGGGQSVAEQLKLTGDALVPLVVTIPAAKQGVMGATGHLTMNTGHGITTGQKLDVYWAGGRRMGLTVGTVATNDVPVSGGTGDALPASATALKAMVPVVKDLPSVDGDGLLHVSLKTPKTGHISLLKADDTVVLDKVLVPPGANNSVYEWHAGNGDTNPLAGATLTQAVFSHGEIAGIEMSVVALFN